MDFMMSCDGMKPQITSGGGGGGLQWPNKTLMSESRIRGAAGTHGSATAMFWLPMQ